MADARPGRLPVLDRLAADRSPAGAGAVNQAGLDFYSRLVDELLERGIAPVAHALPLGPAAGAGGRGRLDRPRHRRAVRRVRRRSWPARSVTGSDVDDAERAVVLGLPRLRLGRARAGPHEPAAALAAAHHLLLAHGLARRARCGRRCRRGPGVDHAEPARCAPAVGDRPADATRSGASTASANRVFLDPICRRRYPDDVLADTGIGHRLVVRAGRRPRRRSRRRIDVLGVNYYTTAPRPAWDGVRPEQLDADGHEPAGRAPGSDRPTSSSSSSRVRTPRWAGRSTRPA